MRTLIALLAAVGGFTVLAADANACSSRGTFCGHPDWAANAFEGPRGSHAKGQVQLGHHGHAAYAYAHADKPVYNGPTVYVVKKHHHKKHH